MTVFHLKLIAVITMLIDHIGLFFLPEIIELRIIGRFSFPIFAFLIANGARHTHNKTGYLIRLGVFALLSQIPYFLVYWQINPSFTGLNIFVTLFLGLLAITASQKATMKYVKIGIIILISLVATALNASYGAAGVLSIVIFHYFFNRIWFLAGLQAIIFLMSYSLPALYEYSQTAQLNAVSLFQPVGVGSLAFIAMYNRKRGPAFQYVFYLFYPLHLLIMYLILIWYS